LPAHRVGRVATHDRADFAQEFLRRNPAYRAAWAAARATGDCVSAARAWGLVTLFDPDQEVRAAPAFWHPACAAQVVPIGPAPSDLPGAALLPPELVWNCACPGDGGRHLIADVHGARHRFRLAPADFAGPLAILLGPRCERLRAIASEAARRMIAGLSTADAAAAMRPSALQRQRLALLLQVLDASLAGASNREIGLRIVYPWLGPTVSTEWKSSSERRRVQRLCAEAHQLSQSGYRALLKP